MNALHSKSQSRSKEWFSSMTSSGEVQRESVGGLRHYPGQWSMRTDPAGVFRYCCRVDVHFPRLPSNTSACPGRSTALAYSIGLIRPLSDLPDLVSGLCLLRVLPIWQDGSRGSSSPSTTGLVPVDAIPLSRGFYRPWLASGGSTSVAPSSLATSDPRTASNLPKRFQVVCLSRAAPIPARMHVSQI